MTYSAGIGDRSWNFAIFEFDIKGKKYILCQKDEGLSLPGVELVNGDDPEPELRKECIEKIGLDPIELELYRQTPFKLWIDEIGEEVTYRFFKVKKYEGEPPSNARYVPSEYFYDIIDDIEFGMKKIRKPNRRQQKK